MKMQYPNTEGNTKVINPVKLNKIEEFDLYLLEYIDESKKCECSTILYKTNDGFKPLPLLNHNLLLTLIENNKVNLTPINPYEIMINPDDSFIDVENQILINPDDSFLNKQTSQKNITAPTYNKREAIIIYIDENNRLWLNNRSIKNEDLCEIMQLYDIEWRKTIDNQLASDNEIEKVINVIRETGVIIEEKYRFGDVRHYRVAYYYKTASGSIRGNTSV